MAKLQQVSFAAGEVSPSLYARTDFVRYSSALRKCLNFFVRPTGGVSNRAGTRFVAATRYANRAAVLVPFVYNVEQAYILEVGHQYIRVYANGAVVGSDVVTTYAEEDLAQIRFTQSADVLTLVHPSYPPAEFRRTSATTFTLTVIEFTNGPFLPDNGDEAVTVEADGATGGITITASANIFNADMVGSLLRLDEQDLSAIPPWEPSKLLAASGNNPQGELRRANAKVYRCTTNQVAGANGTYTGTVRPSHEEGIEADGDGNAIGTSASRAGVDWEYVHSGFGIVRITAYVAPDEVDATVLSELPESVVSPGTTNVFALGAWSDDQGYPSVVTYYQDRLVFANSPGSPQTEWASRVGDYHNFGVSSPLTDADAISQTLNARQVNAIRELVPLDQLVALTANSAWASPKRGEAWTAETIGFDPQSYDGSAAIRSVLVGDTALYVENNATKVRDLRYSFEADKFSGNELTVLARHLFTNGNQIVDMDYAREPHGILWCVRQDGTLAGLTYLREQDVVGWHRHSTQGEFERICVIPEGGIDTAYVIVRRDIDGASVRYIERFAVRDVEDLADYVLMDSARSFDGRVSGATVILSASAWEAGATITITASAATFTGSGPDEVRVRAGGAEVAIRVDAMASSTVLTGTALSDIPNTHRGTPIEDWGVCFDTFSGLDHLEGAEVVALADGSEASGLTVTSGAVTLQSPAERVHIGLAFTAEIETLDLSMAGVAVIRDRAKVVNSAAVIVQDTVGLEIGPDAERLEQIPWRELENYDEATRLFSGSKDITLQSGWDVESRLLLRQSSPLPCTILGILPDVRLGEAA